MGRLARWWPVWCALFAYVPALLSSPSRMPADTKLALYLDPARLTAEATDTFDPAQYAGWVPHQQIAYLWPSGPWYTLFDWFGLSDQLAHRWWIGTILLAAGTGVGWALRRLGVGVTAALAGALLYQLSPYVLPYVSRTSALLLPFAGLGWIVGATLLAARDRRRLPWRWPATIALVVATVGAVNATALIMIVPGPVLALLYAARFERLPWRRVALVGALTTAACTVVSVWWIAMLTVQQRHGPDVLAYSESLRSVSTSSTAVESLRGLGYWLFYVRDHLGATTTASIDHLDDPAVIALGFAAVLVPLLGLVLDRSPRALLGAWCVATGVVVAVGVHPIDDPSPLISIVGGDLDGGLALALRSSTRAVPVALFGLALGAALLVERSPWPSPIDRRLGTRRQLATAVVLVALAFAATPSWWTAALVDPHLDRDPDVPTAWLDGAAALESSAIPAAGTARVLQLPGAEFGAFDWGVTVDQPLPYLGDRAVVTRDLLPLGSPAAMDLAFALDDRLQDGVFEPAALDAVARWLGADRIWVAGDLDVERYDTARPGVLLAALERTDLTPLAAFGEPAVPGTTVVDEELLGLEAAARPVPAVSILATAGETSLVRVGGDEVVLVGTGDGAIDAAAAGVLTGDDRLVAAPAVSGPVDRLVITDSHRDRAHHWRSSQDVHGFTESAAPGSDLLEVDEADERLPVFDGVADVPLDDTWRTVSEQLGPVTARATGYGEPFAYLPEHRPAMANDGDPGTAWTVGGHGDPLGHRIRLDVAPDSAGADRLRLVQPAGPDDRTITEVLVESSGDAAAPRRIALDERSLTADGQWIDVVVPPGGAVSITITGVSGGRPSAVGFSEIDLGLGPTVEWIRTPVAVPDTSAGARIDVVLTRLRAEPTDRWRDDPEPVLRRRVPLPSTVAPGADLELAAQVRLDPRAPDVELAAWLGDPAVSSGRLLGAPRARGASALDGDVSTSWITPFGSPIGPSLTLTGVTGRTDTIELVQPDGPFSRITDIRLDDEQGSVTVAVTEGTIALPRPVDLTTATLTITGAALERTVDRRFGDVVVLPAAIAELGLGPEASWPAPARRVVVECATGWLLVDGTDVPLSFTADTDALLDGVAATATPCATPPAGDGVLEVVAGPPPGFEVDRVVATLGAPSPGAATPAGGRPTWTVADGSDPRRVTIDACPDGCWVVLGHGFNTAWRAHAEADGSSVALGAPTLVDANANGWWLEPFAGPRTVRFEWTAQRSVSAGVTISVVAVSAIVAALVIAAARDRRRRTADGSEPAAHSPEPSLPAPSPSAGWTLAIAYPAASLLLVGPVAGIAAAIVTVAVVAVRRRLHVDPAPAVALAAVTALATAATVVVVVVAREHPAPDLSWPAQFETWHRPTVFALVTLVAALEATRVGAVRRATVRSGPERGRGGDR